MLDNGSVKIGGDDVEKRIVERLGARQKKLERMAAWENSSKGGVRRLYTTLLSVAACVALVFVSANMLWGGNSVIEELGIAAPRMEAFRAALPEMSAVEQLIDKGEYYKALDITEEALKRSDNVVKGYEKQLVDGDEEMEYEYMSERMLNSELRWTYIYLLVLVECEDTAVKELEKYLADSEFCVHKREAEAMLRALE